MSAKTFVALVAAAMLAAQVPAQERPLGHESAVGPHTGAHAPGQGAPAQAAPGGAPPPGAVGRPAPNRMPGNAPRSPAFGRQPGSPAPAPAMRPNPGPAGAPRFDQQHAQHMATHVVPGRPIEQAPRAFGAVPAPYRGDMHRFVDQDAHVWRTGRWHHSHHDGRIGWWWVVGGLWYFYPQPIYPYPDPFVPGDVAYAPGGMGPYWYYCQSAGQYYPYVTYCPEGWVPVVPDQ
ncbi:hypothetical protein AB1286_04960 [Trinickia sp. NRRL B-1857]|uniref:hypothetical protein n=1 Tax=Trinickia sp. NRRL B-1857 TaxID=3162879 RepID=UPI003D279E79